MRDDIQHILSGKSLIQFAENNGFINKKNQDYYNEELVLILEDLHEKIDLLNMGCTIL